uniref:ATP synthase F0 subunit 8 n=1 Tax=Brachyrhynchus hsiaoi TaxID=928820 RepID=A0A059P0N2_9HEMI|nr:ATP synthase F0 subunit 8 [Brachyrhynchus hsiaoi]ADQ64011.1 ATP synthase F0 subunit 8 [Brachyrhynchus hsiaoi]
MPHMSPMMWSATYMTVIGILMLMSTMMFFYFAPKSKKCKTESNPTHHWQW